MKERWNFQVALYGPGGRSLGRHACDPDLEPAREALCLAELCEDRDGDIPSSVFKIDPIWDAKSGEPHLAGIRVSHGARECVVSPRSAFENAVRGIKAKLGDLGQIGKEEDVEYQGLAFLDAQPLQVAPTAFQIEELPSMPAIREADLGAIMANSARVDETTSSKFRVFIPRQVIDQLHARAVVANGIETGSILLGHLCRDQATRALAAMITAQIPAEATEGDATRLTFTAATWEAAMANVRSRGRDEIMLGSSHSHPARAWCAKCPREKKQLCPLAQPFLSPEDKILHRTVFARAWTVSLVVVDALDGVRHGLFGWHQGELLRRGYHLLDAGDGPPFFPEAAHSTQSSHASNQHKS